MISDSGVTVLVVLCVLIGFGFAAINFLATRAVKVDALSGPGEASASDNLLVHPCREMSRKRSAKLRSKLVPALMLSSSANTFTSAFS